MVRGMLDNDVVSFIKASIRSTWALELLLLMRAKADVAFTVDELVRALRASPTLIASCLEQLQRAGLALGSGETWRYAPAAPALDELVEKLERAYAERPVAIINTIVGTPNDRLKSFSDAFKFPRKGD